MRRTRFNHRAGSTQPAAFNQLVDLGAARRDQISALANTKAPSDYEARLVRARHQAHFDAAVSTADATDREILAAWNDPGAFSTDSLIANLPNRFDGQGHRARLREDLKFLKRQSRHEDIDGYPLDEDEQRENRFGEERAMYRRRDSGYSAQATCLLDSRPFRDNTPRRLPSNDTQQGVFGQNHAHPDTSNRRAYSPRSHGTRQFQPQGRCAAPTPLITAPAPQTQPENSNHVTNAPGAAVIPPTQPANRRNAGDLSNAAVAPPAGPANHRAPAISSILTVSDTPPPGLSVNDNNFQRLKRLSKDYAAKPGPEADNWIMQHPEHHKWLLDRSRLAFFKNAVAFAQNPESQLARVDRETHKDRQWITDAASLAIRMLQTGSAADIDRYYRQGPEHRDILDVARMQLKLKPAAVNTGLRVQPPPTKVDLSPAPNMEVKSKKRAREEESSSLEKPSIINRLPSVTNGEMASGPQAVETTVVDDIPTPKSIRSLANGVNGTHRKKDATVAVSPGLKGNSETIIHDVEGRQLRSRWREMDTPFRINMSITPTTTGYSPADLIAKFEGLADQMTALFLRATASAGRKLGDAVQTSDGVWEEVS